MKTALKRVGLHKTKCIRIKVEEGEIISIDKKHKTFALSIRAKDVADEKAAIQDYTRKDNQVGTSLGDIFKELEANKE